MRHLHPGSVPQPSSPSRPPMWQVTACLSGAVVAMGAALYFAGRDLTPIALMGTTLFVMLGGLGFELARRRARD